jgi:hypothetical protein
MPLKRPGKGKKEIDPLITDIKLKTKEAFIRNKHLLDYKNKIKNAESKYEKLFIKSISNIHLLNSKLTVIFRKGVDKDLTKAEKTLKRFKRVYNLSLDLYNRQQKQNANQKSMLKLKNENVYKTAINSTTLRYTKILNELVQKSQKIKFIEQLNPLIDNFVKEIDVLFKHKKDKEKLN